jgi:hypothetical protein
MVRRCRGGDYGAGSEGGDAGDRLPGDGRSSRERRVSPSALDASACDRQPECEQPLPCRSGRLKAWQRRGCDRIADLARPRVLPAVGLARRHDDLCGYRGDQCGRRRLREPVSCSRGDEGLAGKLAAQRVPVATGLGSTTGSALALTSAQLNGRAGKFSVGGGHRASQERCSVKQREAARGSSSQAGTRTMRSSARYPLTYGFIRR